MAETKWWRHVSSFTLYLGEGDDKEEPTWAFDVREDGSVRITSCEEGFSGSVEVSDFAKFRAALEHVYSFATKKWQAPFGS